VVVLANLTDNLVLLLRQGDLLEVADDARLLDTLGNDRVATVDAPGNQNLGGGDLGANLGGDLLDFVVVNNSLLAGHYKDVQFDWGTKRATMNYHTVVSERAVCGNMNTLFLAVRE
jgi:hypothetical protein